MNECPSGKVPHESKTDATREAIKMNAKPDDGKGGINEPFWCTKCGQWHIGRKSR